MSCYGSRVDLKYEITILNLDKSGLCQGAILEKALTLQ